MAKKKKATPAEPPTTGWSVPAWEALRASTADPVARYDPKATPGYTGNKASAAAELTSRGQRLADLQEMLFANGRSGDHRSVLLVIQGMDTAGKGGIVRHVGGMVDPQGLAIKGFGKPTPEELSHDFLWRIHRALPAAGRIGIFDRSHYEDVLPVRVLGALFRSRDFQNDETELVVIVTPYLVDPTDPQGFRDPDRGYVTATDARTMLFGNETVGRMGSSRKPCPPMVGSTNSTWAWIETVNAPTRSA